MIRLTSEQKLLNLLLVGKNGTILQIGIHSRKKYFVGQNVSESFSLKLIVKL